MTTSVRVQYKEIHDLIFKKHLPEFQEIYGKDLGRQMALKYSELSARLTMHHEHKKIKKLKG